MIDVSFRVMVIGVLIIMRIRKVIRSNVSLKFILIVVLGKKVD